MIATVVIFTNVTGYNVVQFASAAIKEMNLPFQLSRSEQQGVFTARGFMPVID